MAWGNNFFIGPNTKEVESEPLPAEWPIGKPANAALTLEEIEWPTEAINKLLELEPIPPTVEEMAQGLAIRHVGWDLGTGGKTATYVYQETPEFPAVEFNRMTTIDLKEHTNKVPTHDPYTNPNAQIYYECGCGAILDPGTKRFAELNNCASKAGWKIRFGETGYTPYCVKCGEGVE